MLAASLGALPGCGVSRPDVGAAYAEGEALYLADGKFRVERDPADAPLSLDTLAGNFAKIAFKTEAQDLPGGVRIEATETGLIRWESDIPYAVFGASPEDRAFLSLNAAKLARLTGRAMPLVDDPSDAAMQILVLDDAGRYGLLQGTSGGLAEGVGVFLQAWAFDISLPCVGTLVTDPETNVISGALILVKAELGKRFREACFTEEVVQSLGLINDDPTVRPSIFNDDQEFVALTRHDEYLIRILYDPRLKPGMTARMAQPIIRIRAAELLANEGASFAQKTGDAL